VSLLYAQAVHSVVRCDALPVSEKVALQLAGLQAQAAMGDPPPPDLPAAPDHHNLYHDVDMFLPQRVRAARFAGNSSAYGEGWVPILMEAHRHYGRGLGEIEAKAWYLRCVMQYPTYGSTLFPVAYKGYWVQGGGGGVLVLGVNAGGLLLLKRGGAGEQQEAAETVLFQFPYREIESILLDPRENFVTVTLLPQQQQQQYSDTVTVPRDQQQRVFVLETTAKAEIGALIASYCPTLASANGIREASVAGGASTAPLVRKFHNKQITNEDRQRLNGQLVGCRRVLVDSNLLRKPVDDGGKGFIKNTLRKLSARKLEKLRAEALTNEQGEAYKGFPHTYWAFTRSTLTQTLTIISEEEDEQSAIQIFGLILTYAGLIVVNTGTSNKEENSSGGNTAVAGVKKVKKITVSSL
jgi:FERM central domain